MKKLPKKWMVRFSNNGVSYDGFEWMPIGEWTECPDWIADPYCGHGLHGQGEGGWGSCQTGTRFELCEVDEVVIIAGNKMKTNRAKIIAIDEEAFSLVNGFPISLRLRGYPRKLPDDFTYCGGYLDLYGYKHKLPDGFTHCGKDLYLSWYKYKLPDGFTYCGGRVYSEDYRHKLPNGFWCKQRIEGGI